MTPYAVVVIMGLPFLDQLMAIAWKYVGTSMLSNRELISLHAKLASFHSGSVIGGLNWRINRCGLALGLVGVTVKGCLVFEVGLCVGLITIGLADLTQ